MPPELNGLGNVPNLMSSPDYSQLWIPKDARNNAPNGVGLVESPTKKVIVRQQSNRRGQQGSATR